MRYPGSKARFARAIAGLIEQHRGDRETYLEPFIGGANSFRVVAPTFRVALAGDGQADIAALWQAVAAGWRPPESVTEAEYQAARFWPPGALRGFIGSGCSFGGKWFGGYARGGYMADGSPRNHQAESARAVLAAAPAIRHATIEHRSYESWPVDGGHVVYADPPYAGTLRYAGESGRFDHEQFWKVAESWADTGAVVLVSEQTAPPGWQPALTFDRRTSVALAADRSMATEHVFMREE